ncbi:MAG: PAS domain-containing protein [Sulfurimonas sp.]|nr:PAS domain-containing protein [Sulfurimonas sp.]
MSLEKKTSPVDEEILLDPKRYIVSETDAKGKLTYCNEYFIEVAGYTKEELLNHSHNIIRHPDMPKVIFKLLWETIQSGKNINAVVKNMAKDGRYYWVFTEFETVRENGEIVAYKAHRKNVSKHIVEIISSLYDELLKIEKEHGVEASQVYLQKYMNRGGNDINFSNIMEEIHRFY